MSVVPPNSSEEFVLDAVGDGQMGDEGRSTPDIFQSADMSAHRPTERMEEPFQYRDPLVGLDSPVQPWRGGQYCCRIVIFAALAVIFASMAVPAIVFRRMGTAYMDTVDIVLLPNMSSIVTDSGHTCAVLADSGNVVCWGEQIGVPSNLKADPSTQLALGEDFTCALVASGELTCWGDDRAAGYVQLPDDLGLIDFITASGGTVCAISRQNEQQEQGHGRCWGFYEQGRVELVIPSSGPLLSIAAPKLGELQHVCGILQDNNRLECWKSDMSQYVLEEVPLRKGYSAGNNTTTINNVISAAVMQDFVCAVMIGGSLSCWAFDDTSSQFILPTFLAPSTTIFYTQVIPAVGNSFCALLSDGQPICSGTNVVIPDGVGPLSQLSIGTNHMCGISLDASFTNCWGRDPLPGQLSPLQLKPLYGRQVAAGAQRTCAVDRYQTRVVCWGRQQYQMAVHAADISIGDEITCVVDAENGLAKCVVSEGTFFVDNGPVDRVRVSRYNDIICTLSANRARCFRALCEQTLFRDSYRCAAISSFVGNPDSELGLVTALELNQYHYCAIDLQSYISCGVLDPTQNHTEVPQAQVPEDVTGVRDMALGNFFTCAVLEDYTVRCWGDETRYGQEFVLDTPLGSYYRAITATDSEVCAITIDDFVHCWGRPFSNALYIPAEVNFVKELTAGSSHFCALLYNEQVICWGSNQYGELSLEYYLYA
jgi:Regulator of chromosome condensation (RCC1) repeat